MSGTLESRKAKALVANIDMPCEAMEAVTPQSELEKVLYISACECAGPLALPAEVNQRLAVLKTRLLPLLEAGQVMREVTGISLLAERWDAAMRAAMKAKP